MDKLEKDYIIMDIDADGKIANWRFEQKHFDRFAQYGTFIK